MKNVYFVIFFFLVFILSCGKREDTKTENLKKTETISKVEDTKITEAGSKSTDVKKNNSDSTIKKLPDDFPADFPIYKNAVISSSKPAEGKVIFESDDNITAVSNFYKSEMPKNGYKAESDTNFVMTNKGGIISYSKDGKKYELIFRFSDAATKTILIVNFY